MVFILLLIIMKQRYLLWMILCFPFLLTWCFDILDWDWMVNEVNEETQIENVEEETVKEEPIIEETQKPVKTELTLEDFDYINANLMPKSYHYKITNHITDEFITEWDYEYSEDAHTVLEPPHLANKEIVSSELYENVIYITTIKYTLDDWQKMEVTYYNDANTLKYLSALYHEWQRSTNYEFNY